MTQKREYILAGVLMKRLLSRAETSGLLSLFENRSDGPSRTPIHEHTNEDETLYLLEGEMHAIIAGDTHVVKTGESIFLPRDVPHQLVNPSSGLARYLLLCTPGGSEDFLAEAGHLRAPDERVEQPPSADVERLRQAAPRFGITLPAGW